MILSLFLLLILISIPVIIFSYTINATKNVQFVDQAYFDEVVDASPYFQRMNETDLIVRRASTAEDYRFAYKRAYTPFNIDEKRIISDLAVSIEKTIGKKWPAFMDFPWKFAKVTADIENGYPHTLGDIIIVSPYFFSNDRENQRITLVHERVHVFQRKNPRWVENVIKEWGYIQWPTNDALKSISRNNPDINEKIYGKDDGPIVQTYLSSPITLTDSQASIIKETAVNRVIYKDIDAPSYVKQLEHPYEVMACIIPEMLLYDHTPTTHMEKALLHATRQ